LTAFLGYSPKWYKLNYKYYNNKQINQRHRIKTYYNFNKLSKRYNSTLSINKIDIYKSKIVTNFKDKNLNPIYCFENLGL
jgi:hypothetical protein